MICMAFFQVKKKKKKIGVSIYDKMTQISSCSTLIIIENSIFHKIFTRGSMSCCPLDKK